MGHADDPSAGVSNDNLRDFDGSIHNQPQAKSLQPPRNMNVPSTVVVPPKIRLSTEEDVKDLSEEEVAQNSNEIGKSK